MVRLAGVLAAGLVAFAACTGDPSTASSTPVAAATTDSVASHTPTELRHPCAVITARVAGRALGRPVTARHVRDPLSARALECGYGRALDVVSEPDVRPLPVVVGLYIGVDRLLHHPVDVPGSDGAAVILEQDDAPTLTLFAKQGFVTHRIVVNIGDLDRAERVAVELATQLVAGNA